MNNTGSKDCCGGGREAAVAVPFEQREQVLERLRQGPGEEARREAMPTAAGPPPSRWTLRTIRASIKTIQNYTLSGVWRWLRRKLGVKLRSGRVQHFSPDPQYRSKVAKLKRCLRAAAQPPGNDIAVHRRNGVRRLARAGAELGCRPARGSTASGSATVQQWAVARDRRPERLQRKSDLRGQLHYRSSQGHRDV